MLRRVILCERTREKKKHIVVIKGDLEEQNLKNLKRKRNKTLI